MTAMPTIQTPEGFLLECQRRGIKLTAKAGAIRASGKPPANPEKFAAFLRAKKPELLALLSSEVTARLVLGERPIEGSPLPQLKEVGRVSPASLEQIGTEDQATLRRIETEKSQSVLAWALTEARHGNLPEPSGALSLPSGQVCPADGAAAWLLAAQVRAVGLAHHSHTSVDCTLALEILQRDMEALARWSCGAWLWLHSPVTHQGAYCALDQAL